MNKKILFIATGGTVDCELKDNILVPGRPFKVLEKAFDQSRYELLPLLKMLSEDMNYRHWQLLVDTIKSKNPQNYKGIIISHGSDTLRYTAAILANFFPKERICLFASNIPTNDVGSDAFDNFLHADLYVSGDDCDGVAISYGGITLVQPTLCRHGDATKGDNRKPFTRLDSSYPPVESPVLKDRNILVITPHPNIRYESFCLDGVDAILHSMYHSPSVPSKTIDFYRKCTERGIPFYFVSGGDLPRYESSSEIADITYTCSMEAAYARLMLGANDFS